jgi:hypothetical protein
MKDQRPQTRLTAKPRKPQVKRNPRSDAKFFEALAVHGVVGAACEISGYSRAIVYEFRKTDKEFARQWEEALERSTERMEEEAFKRAVYGSESYVVNGGRVAYIEVPEVDALGQPISDQDGEPVTKKVPLVEYKKSDTLMIFLLKGRRPEVYRERYDINVGPKPPEGPQELSDQELEEIAARQLTEEQLEAIAQEYLARKGIRLLPDDTTD